MNELIVILPGKTSERLIKMLDYSLNGYEYITVKTCDEISDLKNKRILFAVELADSGINVELYRILEKINLIPGMMENSTGSVIISSNSEFYTRDVARKIILYANMAGCTFPGRPLCEATRTLKNYNSYRKKLDLDLFEICLNECRKTVDNLMSFSAERLTDPKILTLHASNFFTSNTLTLYNKVKNNLDGYNIREIHIENGSVSDCKGCVYTACKHFSESNNCFYGGIMVDEVYPAILDCDIMIMLCPNYNDSISANMSAVINRLTALFRKTKFYDKYFYAIIVSGYSGSDIIAQQLISALNINKTFILPKRFAMMETANDIGDVEKLENIDMRAEMFAKNIKSICKFKI